MDKVAPIKDWWPDGCLFFKLLMMIDLPSSDQASSEGPALIPIVGDNTERGGQLVLAI